MTEELDVQKVAAEFVTQNLEKFFDAGKSIFKGTADKFRLHLDRSYKAYLECVIRRYSKAKSFFIRNEPTNLYDFYIPVSVTSGKRTIDRPSISTLSAINPFTVITGSGGSGKTMLMRHLLLDAVIRTDKVPIFLELRELNQSEQTLLEFIKETLHANRFTLDDEYIDRALKAGHFALIFDGFDELTLLIRDRVRKQLFQLAKHYDQNCILVTSRPDKEFGGWSEFTVFHMDALTLGQAVRLVERLPFDYDLKTKFTKDLKGGMFVKHKSFLSNPLLLSIMLLTYGESADIPNKLSIFYSQAYATLFQRHDTLKAGFQRERLTGLDIQDFSRVFSAFCVQTLDKRQFQMSEAQALEYLDRAKKIFSLEFNTGDFLKDAEQAVCLLVEEGLTVTFSHRSFQEYFVAKFISDAKPDIQQKLMDRYAQNLQRDNVIKLLYEMRPELVEQKFVIPSINKLAQVMGVKKKVGITHFLRYMKTQYSVIELTDDEISGSVNTKHGFYAQIHFFLDTFGHLIGWDGIRHSDVEAETKRLFKKLGVLEIKTSELTSRHDLLRGMALGHGYFSIMTMQKIMDIRDLLIERHKEIDKSLDELIVE